MKAPDNDLRLSWADRWYAIKSIFLLQSMALALRVLGFRRVYNRLNQAAASQVNQEASADSPNLREAIRIGRLVGIANRRFHSLQVPCLPESLTVWWLLQKRTIPAILRLGVRKQDGSLDAHAWVEYSDQVISGDPSLPAAFVPVDLHMAANQK